MTNQGLNADQSVPYLYVHVIPRRKKDGLVYPWTGQRPGRYNTKGKLKHPEDVKPKTDQKRKGIYGLMIYCQYVVSVFATLQEVF